MNIETAKTLAVKKLTEAKIASAFLDAEVLLAFVLKKPREFVLAHGEKKLSAPAEKNFRRLIARRAKHEPVARLSGNKEFFGLKFAVNRHTLVPRPETETLVEYVLRAGEEFAGRPVIADIGTGSGCVAIAVKKNLPRAETVASDISAPALAAAKLNARRHRTKIKFLRGDMLSPLIKNKIDADIVVANPPYIESGFKLKSAAEKSLSHEPPSALYAGRFGLDAYDKMFSQISRLKRRPKMIFCEINPKFYRRTAALAKKFLPDFSAEIKNDFAGRKRFLILKSPPASGR